MRSPESLFLSVALAFGVAGCGPVKPLNLGERANTRNNTVNVITGRAYPVNVSKFTQDEPTHKAEVEPFSETTSIEQLTAFLQKSEKLDMTESGSVGLYSYTTESGANFEYVLIRLDENVNITPLTAHDALPVAADGNVKRWWSDGGEHLEHPEHLIQRNLHSDNGSLVFATTGDFWPEPNQTIPEGPFVRTDKGIRTYLYNNQRAGIGITTQGDVEMGYFNPNDLQRFESVFGGLAVIVPGKNGVPKVVDTTLQYGQETETEIFFNPFNEYFANIDYRKHLWDDNSKKSVMGIIYTKYANYIMISYVDGYSAVPVSGPVIGQEMRKAGVSHAILLDGNSQTTACWIKEKICVFGDPLPVMIGVYNK